MLVADFGRGELHRAVTPKECLGLLTTALLGPSRGDAADNKDPTGSNQRSDEYGGSLENRVRLLRELIEDTKDAVGDRCGVVVRLAVESVDLPNRAARFRVVD